VPKVDCWRLLGISTDAGPAEVRAAFARRARDVHPDSGGTGDGLTLRLLAEARDEALAYLGEQTGERPPNSPGQRWDAKSKADPPDHGDGPAKGEGIACHGCGRLFPPERLEHQLVGGGIRGRAGSSMALVCRACAVRAEERRKNRRFIALAVCLGAVIFLGLALV
jgi:hypothetical protein